MQVAGRVKRFLRKKNVCHSYFKAHKPPTNFKKIVNMNADISETIKDRELGLQI